VKVLTLIPIFFLSLAVCSAQKESLTIGPGDMLHISVLESADLEQHVRVTDSGDASLILGGKVRLLGLSPDAAAVAIEKTLVAGDYVLNPHVSVTVEHYAKLNVGVVGQVRAPGSYETDTPRSILDVLALAGGLTDMADRRITIERSDTKEQILYFVSNNSAAALKEQAMVFPGDTIVVPRASFVYVLGDVGHPGAFAAATNDSNMTVLQAVALAGGTPPNAVPSKARLIRKAENGAYIEIALSLSDMQKGKRSDLPMQADDIVYVPFSYARNMLISINGILAAAASASIYRF
jgi:polysaccharide export outer membrane protein